METKQNFYKIISVTGIVLIFFLIKSSHIFANTAGYIVSVSEPQIVYGKNTSAEIWAEIKHPEGTVINRVWAEIIPPVPVSVFEIELRDTDNDGIYKGVYENFVSTGDYIIIIYAADTKGITASSDTTVTRMEFDDYEDDDTFEQANVFILGGEKQSHNFHDSDDADWVKFYGFAGKTYTVKVSNLISSCNAVIQIFGADGNTILKELKESENSGEIVLLDFNSTQESIYYVKLSNFDPLFSGENVKYNLEVYIPDAPAISGFIEGTVRNIVGAPIKDALIKTTDPSTGQNSASGISQADGSYMILQNAGTWQVIAMAPGYETSSPISVTVSGLDVNNADFELVSRGDIDSNGVADLTDAILALQIMAGLFPGNVHLNGDVNKDGKIGLEEAVYILQILGGM